MGGTRRQRLPPWLRPHWCHRHLLTGSPSRGHHHRELLAARAGWGCPKASASPASCQASPCLPPQPSASQPSRFPLWRCHQALASLCACGIAARGIAHSPRAEGKTTRARKAAGEGRCPPHPSPHQLRLTGPGPPRAGRMCESGVRLTRKQELSHRPQNQDQPQASTSAGQSLPLEQEHGLQSRWGDSGWGEQRGGCEHRDKESSGHGDSACRCEKPQGSWKRHRAGCSARQRHPLGLGHHQAVPRGAQHRQQPRFPVWALL